MILRTLQNFEYVLKAERQEPVEKQTVFVLKPASARAQFQLRSKMVSIDISDKNEPMPRINNDSSYMIDFLSQHLVEWRNFLDSEHNQVVYRPSSLKDVLEAFPVEVIEELFAACLAKSELQEHEEKN